MNDVLRVALVVPRDCCDDWYRADALRQTCHDGRVDLVVFPEWFFDKAQSLDACVEPVAKEAAGLGVPVLAGVGVESARQEAYQAAVYINPHPHPGDTTEHVYVKHSSADRLAFQMPGYRGKADPMFGPIKLRGRHFGVQVCHDMFFGLVGMRTQRAGATATINITGGNVQLNKWKMLAQARSIELGGTFLCTMKHDPRKKRGQSRAFGYHDGIALIPIESHTDSDGTRGFEIFPWLQKRPTGCVEVADRFSEKAYHDLRISFAPRRNVDIVLLSTEGGLVVSGAERQSDSPHWRAFGTGGRTVGVLVLPLSALKDCSALYSRLPPRRAFDAHLVAFYGVESPADAASTLALAKLRAIEHRIAVVIAAGTTQEVMKTDNYKHIQRFRPVDGTYGLNWSQLGGTWSTWRNAIPEALFPKYLDLRD